MRWDNWQERRYEETESGGGEGKGAALMKFRFVLLQLAWLPHCLTLPHSRFASPEPTSWSSSCLHSPHCGHGICLPRPALSCPSPAHPLLFCLPVYLFMFIIGFLSKLFSLPPRPMPFCNEYLKRHWNLLLATPTAPPSLCLPRPLVNSSPAERRRTQLFLSVLSSRTHPHHPHCSPAHSRVIHSATWSTLVSLSPFWPGQNRN